MSKAPQRKLSIHQWAPLCLTFLPAVCQAQTLYDFGNPTTEEQLYLELINRARADPSAEGARLANTTDAAVLNAYSQYNVDLAMLQTEFNAISAAPPLAPNAALTTAARGHSTWMLNNATQAHDETNPPNTFSGRLTTAGYNWSTCGENVYAATTSVWYGHAGLNVDWGPGGTGGMQPGRGHRVNIHSSAFREIGVGVKFGTNGAVGPQLVTQDLGTQQSPVPSFGTGVVYYDLNNNNFYDIGEGISDLSVNVSGVTTYYCKTAIGGGWTVPIPTIATTRTVTFSGLGLNTTANLVVPASTNAKADLKLTYASPSITSAATATAGSTHNLTFTAVGGASGYKWNRWNSAAAVAENCESTTNITVTKTGTYSTLNSTVKQQGTSSFHLENSTAASQSFELNGVYFGQTTPAFSFQSRLRASTTSERFKAQVKEEGSTVWQDVYDQVGTNDGGEGAFTLRNAPCSMMAGKAFRVRFVLQFTSGSYFPSSGDLYGWFIDAISFSNISELTNSTTQSLAGTSGSFTPAAEGSYLMSVSPTISGLDFPASYQTLTVSAATSSFLTLAGSFETSNSLPTCTISGQPNADYDNDGRPNLIEYAFGTSPVLPNDPAPRMPVASIDATDFILHYKRDTALTDITLTPVATSNLNTWSSVGQPGAPVGFNDSLVETTGTVETREAKIPLSSGGRWFMRVQVTRP